MPGLVALPGDISAALERSGPMAPVPAGAAPAFAALGTGGPGTEFWKLTQSLGIRMPDNCPCKSTMILMDRLGVNGCIARRAELIETIRANAQGIQWSESVMAAAVTAAAAWLDAFGMDPLPRLFDEAVSRARAAV